MVTVRQARPGLGEILVTWLVFGIQSFGGGSTTFYLMHRACIERGWLNEDEFVRAWALAQMAPGINLLKLTVMMGYQLRGWPGLLLASAGLLLPSAILTVLMTAGFATFRTMPLVQAVMRGILPAAIGLSLANAVQMAQPLFSRARHEGRARLGAHLFILLVAALLMTLTSISPIVIVLLAGAAAALLFAVFSLPALPQSEDRFR